MNPSIISEMIKSKPHIMIVSGYTDPTVWLAFIIARLLKIPIIHWTEGTKEPSSILGRITRPLRIFFVKKPDAIVVPGKLSKNYVVNLGVEPEARALVAESFAIEKAVGRMERLYEEQLEIRGP